MSVVTTPAKLLSGDTVGEYDGPEDLLQLRTYATMLASSRAMVPPLYRGSPGDVFALILRARAVNIPVGTALDHIYVNPSTGKAGLSAQLMTLLLSRSGITWTIVEANDQVVRLEFARGVGRRRRKVATVSWTIAEAAVAKLTARDHWRQFPEDCLFARAIARACRRHFSKAVMSMGYTAEEIADGVDATEQPAVDIDPALQEYIDEAESESATPELIRTEILPRAKRKRMAGKQLPDGRTLADALSEIWARKTAVAADQAAQIVTVTPPDPAVLDEPAGTGTLPCGCPTADIIGGRGHGEECSGRP